MTFNIAQKSDFKLRREAWIQSRKFVFGLLLIMFVLACAATPTKAAPGGKVYRQQTARLTLQWQEGKLNSLYDRETKREWLRAPAVPVDLRLFGASAPKGDEMPRFDAAPPLVWEKTDETKRGTLVHHYRASFPEGKLTLRLTVSATDADTSWSTEWDSTAKLLIAQVRAPYLPVPSAIGGDSADDVLAVPQMDGELFKSPGMGKRPFVDQDDYRQSDYPGLFSAQFQSLYDPASGLLIYTPDGEGWTKQFIYDRPETGPAIGIGHYVSGYGANSYRQPYPVKLVAFTGDWYDAADIYRAWAVTQSWCRRKVAERDYAPMVREPFAMFQDTIERWKPRAPEAFAAHIREFSQMAKAPVIANFFGWEKHGVWVAHDYFPPTGGEAFRAGAELARKDGNRLFAFISGFRFTERSLPGATNRNEVNFEKEWDKIKDEMGVWWWDGSLQFRDEGWKLRNYRLNIGSPAVRELIAGYMLAGPKWGITLMHLDQDVSLRLNASWRQPAGVPIGYGKYVANTAREWFANLRREGRQIDPEYTLTIERPAEFFMQEIDMIHTRLYEPEVAPIFQYLYHDYQVNYSGWTDPPGTFPNADALIYALARGACNGQLIGTRARRLAESPEAAETYVPRLREVVAFQRGAGNDFLIHGRMLPAPKLTGVRMIEGMSIVPQGREPKPRQIESIVTGSFEAPDGRFGTLMMNVTDKAARVRVDPARWKKNGEYRLTRQDLGAGEAQNIQTGRLAPVSLELPAGRFVWLQWTSSKR